MKVFWTVIVSLFTVSTVTLTVFFLIGYLRVKPGGIFVDTTPASSVFINDNFVGRTPYTNSYKAGEITLKMVPDSVNSGLIPYETKVALIPGVQTIVRREFGVTEEESSGDVIFFDKNPKQNTGLFVISTPPNAQISVDGVPRGFTPYTTSIISSAEHQITVKTPGYTDRVMMVRTLNGYRLSLYAKLAKITDGPVTIVSQPKSYVQILTTPTGYLRLRTAPGTGGEEIAELKPGTSYPFLDSDTKTGWIEIQYEASAAGLPNGITGWVSKQYVKIATESGQPTAIPE